MRGIQHECVKLVQDIIRPVEKCAFILKFFINNQSVCFLASVVIRTNTVFFLFLIQNIDCEYLLELP